MKVLVPVKRVIDFNVKIRVSPDGSGVETFNAKMSMNPFDEISVEAAVRLKEAGIADEVIAVSIGPAKAEDTLRQALAMGADRAVLFGTDQAVEPLAVAKLLAQVIDAEGADLVIAGKQAIDDDCHQTGQMLAGLLGWAQASAISSLAFADGHAEVTEEVDGGLQSVRLKLPAVVTTDLRLNEPRFASLPNIMKARQKPLDKRTPEDFGVDIAPRLEIVSTAAPPARKAGVIVSSVDELVARLRDEAELV